MAIAEDLFKTRPYAEIGVADVAKAAGITHGLIYHYFTSKEALFIAVCEDRAKQLLESTLPDPSLPLPERAEQAIRGYLDFVEAHRVSYLNLFRGPNALEGEFLRICEETRAIIMERFLDAMGISELPLPATRLSLRGYLGFAESAVLEWLEHPTVPRMRIAAPHRRISVLSQRTRRSRAVRTMRCGWLAQSPRQTVMALTAQVGNRWTRSQARARTTARPRARTQIRST